MIRPRPMSRLVRLVLANATAWSRFNHDIERARRAYATEHGPAHRPNPRDRSKERR